MPGDYEEVNGYTMNYIYTRPPPTPSPSPSPSVASTPSPPTSIRSSSPVRAASVVLSLDFFDNGGGGDKEMDFQYGDKDENEPILKRHYLPSPSRSTSPPTTITPAPPTTTTPPTTIAPPTATAPPTVIAPPAATAPPTAIALPAATVVVPPPAPIQL
ncbi:hypothetical protein EG327_005404 [Venturia inaequalis]|uniref:Uncharacterized protein n=1 Tax=Venturia inaequalis TaxID=5025 RepID=A0A8H3Z7W0_VENIN|nr:hypothetical protein EG327_005404 [Venturia inaequalis]